MPAPKSQPRPPDPRVQGIGKNVTLELKLRRLERLKALQAEADRMARKSRAENVFADLGFEPNPGPQKRFLELPDEDLDVFFGGALGGGKSLALLVYALRSCVKFDGIQVYWFRCTYPELDSSVLKLLAIKFGYAAALGAKWVSSKYELTFPNGSVLKFTHAKNLQEATALRSAEMNLLILDERTTIPPDVVELLYTRIRSGTEGVPVLGIRAASNPGGPGHANVLEEYVKATDYGAKEFVDKYRRRRIFIQSKLTDTPQLMNDGAYMAALQGLPEDSRRALLEGDWESFSGQMYCCDNRSEVLTESGWRLFSDVHVGDLVATLSPARELLFAPATNVWNFHHDGYLNVYEERALDFAVTDGHRMWTHPYRGVDPWAEFSFVPVENLTGTTVHLRTANSWAGVSPEFTTVTLPSVVVPPAQRGKCETCVTRPLGKYRGRCEPCYRVWLKLGKIDNAALQQIVCNPILKYAQRRSYVFRTRDWYELLGWYLSEGFISRASSGSLYPGRITGFGIAQFKSEDKILQIKHLLRRMGLTDSFDGKRFRIASTVLGEFFAQFGKHQDKFIPREVLNGSRENLLALFDALVDGDGHRAADGGIMYATTSRQLADDMQELCLRLGFVASISKAAPANERFLPCYRISIRQPGRDRSRAIKKKIRRERYIGEVGCVTVEPYHTILVRRNGKAMWMGNSELSRDRHIVEPIELPASWRRYAGIDYGWRAPWAVIWGAVDEDGRIWLYREKYETSVRESVQAQEILAAEVGEEVIQRFADDAMWVSRGEAKSIAKVYEDEGCDITKATKGPGSRKTGFARIHDYLAEAPACNHHRAMGWETCPMLHMFSTCVNLFTELKNIAYATSGDPEDSDPKYADHLIDALRYMLVNIGNEPRWYFEISDDPKSARQGLPAKTIEGYAVIPDGGDIWSLYTY